MSSALQLSIDPAALEPLIRQTVEATIARLDELRGPLGDKLAFDESEAARLLSLEPHQLRDERRRGRVQASVVVNRGIRYLRSDLMAYLLRNRTGVDA
jgi:hypothetical protein